MLRSTLHPDDVTYDLAGLANVAGEVSVGRLSDRSIRLQCPDNCLLVEKRHATIRLDQGGVATLRFLTGNTVIERDGRCVSSDERGAVEVLRTGDVVVFGGAPFRFRFEQEGGAALETPQEVGLRGGCCVSPEVAAVLRDELTCPVCHEWLLQCRAVSPCGHLFCGPCISTWLDGERRCPMCRTTAKCSVLRPHVDRLLDEVAALPGVMAEDELLARRRKLGAMASAARNYTRFREGAADPAQGDDADVDNDVESFRDDSGDDSRDDSGDDSGDYYEEDSGDYYEEEYEEDQDDEHETERSGGDPGGWTEDDTTDDDEYQPWHG